VTRAWLTPDTPAPESERCRRFATPDELAFVAAVSGALLPLTLPENWEQSGSMTPDEAAGIMSASFESFVASDCESTGSGTCTLPDIESPIFRISPTTGHFEQLDNGEWVEPTGDYSIPEPDARPEETEDEQKCGAASNLVNALHELYDAIIAFKDDFIDPVLAQAEVAGQIAVSIGSQFGPISATFLALSGAAWEAFTYILAELTVDDWTEEFNEILTCILKEHIEITDGIASWNLSSVAADLVGFVLPVIDEHVRVRWQVWYLLQCIGVDGMTAGAARTDIEGDCATCDAWCVSVTPETLGFSTGSGVYYNSSGHLIIDGGGFRQIYSTLVVDTSQCVITRIGLSVHTFGAATSTMQVEALPSEGPLSQVWYSVGMTGFPVGRTSDDNVGWYSNSDETTVSVYASNDNSGSYVAITNVLIMGTGRNPFGIGSNC